MEIIFNNNRDEIEGDTISVSEFLVLKKFTYKLRIVKINGKLIKKELYDSTFIKEGDDVKMHYLMSGG